MGFAKANSRSNNAILDYEKIKEKLRELDIGVSDKERECAKALFDYYRAEGQIEFVTFHQNYGYEEFVEGIKPVLDSEDLQNSESSDVGYTIESGIFKEICERAQEVIRQQQDNKDVEISDKTKVWKISLGERGSEAERVKAHCFENNQIRISFKGVADNDSQLKDYNDMNIGDIVCVFASKKTIDAVGVIKGDADKDKGLFDGRFERFRKVKWLVTGQTFDIYKLNKNYGLTQRTIYRLKRIKPNDILNLIGKNDEFKIIQDNIKKPYIKKPYILIIDEINRGNISKILGELITLLEPSKRKGEKEELELTLPYSKESFSVPKNLYIIGTMNTADRSIALLDMALRRRFDFIEMMPNPDSEELSIDCAGINLRELLRTMNNRIEFLLSREQTIGHAFLIDVKNIEDLKAVFQNKIIPLLQEYFYNDYARIAAVLNNNGMIEAKNMRDLGVSFSDEMVDSEKMVYRITESSKWDHSAFKKIYE